MFGTEARLNGFMREIVILLKLFRKLSLLNPSNKGRPLLCVLTSKRSMTHGVWVEAFIAHVFKILNIVSHIQNGICEIQKFT